MRLRAAALAVAFGLGVAACTGPELPGDPAPDQPSPVAPVPSSPEVPSPTPKGPDSAVAAAERLCEVPEPDLESDSEVRAEGPTPALIAQVMRQVEQIRGFGYSERVVAEPVSQEEIGRDLLQYADIAYPRVKFARRSVAWYTIGVIPDCSSLLFA